MAASEETLDSLVGSFAYAATSKSTKSTYRSQLAAYYKFCERYGYTPVPASSVTLCRYIAYLSLTLKPTSIQQYLGVIRLVHNCCGLPNPLENDYQIKSVLKGVRRVKGNLVNRKLPMTLDILLGIKSCLELKLSHDASFWAVCLIAFFGMLRKSSLFPPKEAHPLCVSNVKVFTWGISMSFSYSKTVQCMDRLPMVSLPWNPSRNLCPATALLRAWKLAGVSTPEQPLFPVLVGGYAMPLSKTAFAKQLGQVMDKLGLIGYSGHSFRRGGATHALKAGVPAEVIKAQGDWKSLAYLDYLDLDEAKTRASAISFMYT